MNDINSYEIGQRLSLAIKTENLSLRKFSGLVGKTPGTISNWVSGKIFIPIDCVSDICNVLHCDPKWLLFGDISAAEEIVKSNYIKIYECSISFNVEKEEKFTISKPVDAKVVFYSNEFFTKYHLDHINCILLRVHDDSMEPLINDDELVLVDCSSVKTIKNKGVYVIGLNGNIYIKQLIKPLKGGLIVRSFNQAEYKDEVFNPEEAEKVKIIGRVVDRYGILLKPIR